MNIDPLLRLAEDWRADAERLREYGAEGQARACEKHAEELENRVEAWMSEALSLERAAEEAGYSYEGLRRRVGDDIPNVGEPGDPMVRRCDLPRKGGAPASRLESGEPDVAEEVLLGRYQG